MNPMFQVHNSTLYLCLNGKNNFNHPLIFKNMAIKITEECINCGACEPECPNNAIYEGGVEWAITDGTSVKGQFTLLDGTVVDAGQHNAPISVDTYYIVPNRLTEGQGFHEDPQCGAAWPGPRRHPRALSKRSSADP